MIDSMSRLQWIVVIIICTIPVCFACQPSDDDDDNDTPEEDLHGENGWPEEGLPACPPYHEYEPWFTITNFENAADAFDDAYGEQFTPAVIEMENTDIYLTFNSIEPIAISWLSDEVAAPFENEQNVLVALGEYWFGYDQKPKYLWILDEENQLLLYHDQALRDYEIQIGSSSAIIQYDFTCEYYDYQPPTPEDKEWALVFGRWISGSVNGNSFSFDDPGEMIAPENDEYVFYMPVNYLGQFKGHNPDDAIDDGDINEEKFLLQIVKQP